MNKVLQPQNVKDEVGRGREKTWKPFGSGLSQQSYVALNTYS